MISWVSVCLTSGLSHLSVPWPFAGLLVRSVPLQPKLLYSPVICQCVSQPSAAALCGPDTEPPAVHHSPSEPEPHPHILTEKAMKLQLAVIETIGGLKVP